MWSAPPEHALDVPKFAAALNIHPITARILLNRGISTVDAARLFLDAPISALNDPFLLPDMHRAVDRIVQAIRNREPITVFGDYDTDGVCASALLARFFNAVHFPAQVVLPHRVRDGYGLSVAAVEKIAQERPGLLITVDNGTSAHDAIIAANAAGLDVIITDHHPCKKELPQALACVNPHRLDSGYPFKDLCGTAVAFKLVIALRRALRDANLLDGTEPNLQQLLPYVAIATIADIMPLMGENRILVKRGLQMLASHPGPGLSALLNLSEIGTATLDAEDIAFRIAPRLNAAGRMGDAGIAFQCLFEDDAAVAAGAATTLDRLNTDRQAAEQKILKALDSPEEKIKLEDAAGIAVGSAAYPIGVVGIIAGRLARTYQKPAVVVSFEHGVGKGSVRSIPGFAILPILERCAAHLTAFGGHAQAAGITIAPENWTAFQAAFNTAAEEGLKNHQRPARHVDAVVDATTLTPALGKDLRSLAPFGEGNPAPTLAVRAMSVHSRRMVGVNHLKLRIGDTMTTIDAIGFGLWNHPAAQGALSHVIGVPELNTWRGETTLQLRLLDLNPDLDWMMDRPQ